MDYEKKHEEIVRATQLWENGDITREQLEYIFPELKEDDKIRKGLTDFLKGKFENSCSPTPSKKVLTGWIAWLEKQKTSEKALQYLKENHSPSEVSDFQAAMNIAVAKAYDKGYTDALEKQGESSDKIHYWTEEEIEPIISDYLRGAEHYGGMIGRLRCLKPKSLEKQGKQKSIWHNEDEEPQRGSLILLIMQSGTPIVAKIIEPNHTFNHGERWAYIDDLLEKQDEKKPTDKVEPKFKVGDLVVRNYLYSGTFIYKVIGVKRLDNGTYGYELDDGTYFSGSWENSYHLWTIQDAKDGDVLQLGEVTAIFKEFIGNNNCKCYCSVCNGKFEIPSQNGADNSYGCHNATPATKEQRELLFSKMKEAGYEWDVEKKEPKKIEQKPAIEIETPEESLGIDSDTYNKIVDECVFGEQKPAWSEDDEKMFEYALDMIEWCGSENENESKSRFLSDWLKTLKDRVQPTANKEWGEDDEQYLLVCKNALAKYQTTDKWDANIIFHWLENKIKSLRPQKQWKPTKEQLHYLSWIANIKLGDSVVEQEVSKHLNELYKDLKKLKEE